MKDRLRTGMYFKEKMKVCVDTPSLGFRQKPFDFKY